MYYCSPTVLEEQAPGCHSYSFGYSDHCEVPGNRPPNGGKVIDKRDVNFCKEGLGKKIRVGRSWDQILVIAKYFFPQDICESVIVQLTFMGVRCIKYQLSCVC